MLDIYDFDAVFRFDLKEHCKHEKQRQIAKNRQDLNNKLFFDLLLDSLHVRASDLYPPSSQKLRELHQRITSAKIADHHKQSLLYYILLDCSTPAHEAAEDFAKACHMPHKYYLCMRGLWEMDRKNFRAALDYLCHPSLHPTFPFTDHVLLTLLRHCSSSESDLPLAYYHTASPPLTLTSPTSVLEAYTSYLARHSLTPALSFLRQRPREQQKLLFELLMEEVLGNKGELGRELVGLPLTEEEEGWMMEFLAEEKQDQAAARALVVMRKVVTGRVGEALVGDRDLRRGFGEVFEGFERGMGPRLGVGGVEY